MKPQYHKLLPYIAWSQALLATFGSLFFSEVLRFPPCVLCWYQRMFMYPIALILPIGMMGNDKKVYRYVLPLAGAGALIAAYHNLLYFNVLPESVGPCTAGISCTTQYIALFGFLTIPLLSLLAFLVIIASMVLYAKPRKKQWIGMLRLLQFR